MKGTLTEIALKNAKPGNKRRTMFDGGGLFIVVEPTGGKLWRFQYRFEGKRKLLALGKYPDISLQEARKRHAEARERLTQGIDPSALKKAQKAAGAERAANSFEVVAHQWFDWWSADKTKHTRKNVMARLQKDIFPWIGKEPVTNITPPMTLSVLRRIVDRGYPQLAHRAKTNISQVMRYAVANGFADSDPCRDLRGALPPVKYGNMAALTEPAKVTELLRAIESYQGSVVVRTALRFAPLVFVRPGELRAAKWDDIDLDRAEWKYTVSKTKTEHHVPLARQAVEILRELRLLTGSGKYVFPGTRTGRPISDMTINRALQSMGYDTKEEMTGHGFRAMARTLLAERLHFPAEVIEHQLAHSVPDALGTAYNRTRFLDDRRRMMTVWADYLDKLKAGIEVAQFPVVS